MLILNGKGFFYIEPETRSRTRIDLVISYGEEAFIIELKKWKGQSAHQKAYAQLKGYLDSQNIDTGYLLTFDFNQKMD